MQADLKVAIAHEWLDAPGGAENVLREMLEVLPQADVWSLWALSPARETIPTTVQSTWLARTPLRGKKMAAFPFMPLTWRYLPAREYDVVVTSSYALAHTARFRNLVCPTFHYIHTPARYWWTPEVDARGIGKWGGLARGILRRWDRRIGNRHIYIAANSGATRKRILDFWGIEATVIHPPVATDFFTPGETESSPPFPDYLLGASRWVEYKQLHKVIQTADFAGIPAVIAGSGPMERELRELARQVSVPVHFEVSPSRSRLRDLYRGASALVFPVHEDFGIVPVEAMACGTPVIGPAIGGLLETVVSGQSGLLVADATPELLSIAIQDIQHLAPMRVRESVEKFSRNRFHWEFQDWISEALN